MGYDPCCYPTRTGGCVGCSWAVNPKSTRLGDWGVVVRDGYHKSFIGTDVIWGVGSGREVNRLRVQFDLCSSVDFRITNAGHSLYLGVYDTNEEILIMPRGTFQERSLTLTPGRYHLSVDLKNRDAAFEVDIGSARE